MTPGCWRSFLNSCPNACGNIGISRYHDHGGALQGTKSFLRIFGEWETSLALYTNARCEDLGTRGIQVLQDAVRKRHAAAEPAYPCRITVTGFQTMDETWKNDIVAKLGDKKIRVCVRFHIEGRARCGDLLTTVKLGNVERRDDRFRGFLPGHYHLHFEFDTPKETMVPLVAVVDALETAGNRGQQSGRYEGSLTLG